MQFKSLICITMLFALGILCQSQATAQSTDTGSFVYVMTNAAEANSLLVYHRAPNGSLTLIQQIPTRGMGTGFTLDPLQSQGSLSLSNDHKLLFAVNAGSGDVTAFAVTPGGLAFGSKARSGGALPVSVTAFGNLVYVLNQLGIANITGFTSDKAGHLKPISGSTQELAGAALAQPAQVSFTPDGKQLLVTEKGTDLIDIFDVREDGTTSAPRTQQSSGHTPFGFAFGPSDSVVVSEAERRLPKEASASSYLLAAGTLQPISRRVPDGQTAACWITVTGQTAWVVNTGTSNISSYEVGSGGTLTVLNPVAASTGPNTAPIDLAASPDGKYVYVLKSGAGALAGYKVSGGTLTPIFNKAGLPLSIQGIAIE